MACVGCGKTQGEYNDGALWKKEKEKEKMKKEEKEIKKR